MTTTDQAVAGARRLARRAAQANAGLESCPYPPDGTPLQQAALRAWVRTYLHWRPTGPAVDFTSDDPAPSGVDVFGNNPMGAIA